MEEGPEVTADGGTEGNVVGAREYDITAIDEGRRRRAHGARGVSRGLVLIRVDVVAADDGIGLVRAQNAREGGAVTEDEEVGITRLGHRTGAKKGATNPDVLTGIVATRIDNAGADVRRDVAIPEHVGARIEQRTTVVQHDAGVIAGNGVGEEQLTTVINRDGLTRALTQVGRAFEGELAAINNDVAHVRYGGDVGNLDEARARLGQRVATHVEQAVVAAGLVEEVEAVRTTDGRVTRETQVANEVRHSRGRTIDNGAKAADTRTRDYELLIEVRVVTEDIEGRTVAHGDIRARTTQGSIIDHPQGARRVGDGATEVARGRVERHRARRGEVEETATHEREREVHVVRAFDLEDALRVNDDRGGAEARHAAHADGTGVDDDLTEGFREASTRWGEEALRAETAREEVQGGARRRTEGTDVGGIVASLRDEADSRLSPTGILNE